jgi:hypothetical protein
VVEILLYAKDSRIGDHGLAHRTSFLCTNTDFKQYSHLLSLSVTGRRSLLAFSSLLGGCSGVVMSILTSSNNFWVLLFLGVSRTVVIYVENTKTFDRQCYLHIRYDP